MSGVGSPWTILAPTTPAPTSSGISFVGNGDFMKVADLLANYPASVTYKNKYANVSDLYGSVEDVMRCRFDGTNYRWVPQREALSGTTAQATGTVAIIPLVTPPTLRLTATLLTGNVQIQPSTVNAYNGQRSRIIMPSSITLGLYVVQITGLLGSNLSLLAGNVKDIEFGQGGWFASS